MVRLIDADKLNIYDVSPAYGTCVMGVTEEDIELAPTVDAVPVSWILDQWLNNYYDMPESAKIVIRTMIKKWREENANPD